MTLVAPLNASPDVVTVQERGEVVLWSGPSLQPVAVGVAAGRTLDLDISSDGGVVTTVAFAGTVETWRPEAGGAVLRLDQHAGGEVTSVSFSDDADLLLSSTSAGAIAVRDRETGTSLHSYNLGTGKVDGVVLAPDGDTLVVGVGERTGELAYDDTIEYWSLSSGDIIHQSGGDASDVIGCSFFRNRIRLSPDGQSVAVNSHDFTIELRALDSTLLNIFDEHENSVLDFAFSPDGSQLASSSDDGKIRLWDLDDYSLIDEHATLGGQWTIVFTADGSSLIAGSLSGDIRILDLDSGELGPAFEVGKNRVSNLAISPDGALLAGGDEDNDLVVWDALTGAVEARGTGHSAPILSVAFSSDGSMLATGSRDHTIRLWER